MEPFYKYALLISVVFLIVCLIGIGILMQFQNAGTKFPLHPNVCPDKWKISTDGKTCTKGTTNIGKADTPSPLVLSDYPMICNKYKWAKQYNVNWDGVSNYNGCS